ncbi:hypothetical protein GCM10011344_40950 [Dokdonia pacifica]|uniref:Uncharacterized protein n=1 Tax=Dokdonia pacifica TaxID=1627892 RepID=A0A239AB29_9FLAO|nr:hypothetical protein [Dokdonia pacifica]GGG35853.1 hypothetical protein GCM10011344_40950 [Dokdonia pacifica]SNR92602.1 hypothetical protein SAMN06265376_104281 [Dokdonia pacifica]
MSLKNKIMQVFDETFDQEKKIRSRFVSHSRLLAKDHLAVKGILSLQILEMDDKFLASLFKGHTFIESISLDSIAQFFTDRMSARLISSSHIEEKLKKYFKNFQRDSAVKSIGIRIVILKDETVRIYTLGTQETEEVLLTDFIAFFKS